MAWLCRSLLFCSVLLCAARALGAAPADRDFDAAAKAFRDGFYARAESGFAEYVRTNAASPRTPEAILFQAEARLQLTNFNGAIALLTTNQPAAGAWGDRYLFWLAQAHLRRGDSSSAADVLARLVKEYPASPMRLESAISEAATRSALGEWPRVIESLQQPDGVFQTATRTNAPLEVVCRGHLLLAQAHLTQSNYTAAEVALQPLANARLNPLLDWQRQNLLCRIFHAQDKLEQALQDSTNLVALALASGQRPIQSESFAFQADLLERLGRRQDAILVYEKNLAADCPPELQRQSLLKITKLSLGLNKLAEAAGMLEKFLLQYTNAPSADLALLSLGELRLRQHASGQESNLVATAGATNAPVLTNSLQQALAVLKAFTNQFPQSSLLGKAQLNLGWCYWRDGKMPEAQASFEGAAQRLPRSAEQATALFKLGDTQFRQTNFAGAILSYSAVVDKFKDLAEIRTNLFEPALYQVVRAGLQCDQLGTASNALSQILALCPEGYHTDRALLLFGQAVGRENPLVARQLFTEFMAKVPGARLWPELKLAVARTYERQAQWPEAIAEYDSWLLSFSNHPERERAEYSRAYDTFLAGQETTAFIAFTNFIVLFPTNEFTPLARWWVGDYYLRAGDPFGAERNYKFIFQDTNWAGSTLAYEARMMAGRAAFAQHAQQGWDKAKEYFSKLAGDTNCPVDLRAQAFYAYGDTLISQESTNKLADYADAKDAFDYICRIYTNSPLAPLAWGAKANCLLQLARSSQEYEFSTNSFAQVLASTQANVTARSIAKVGLAVALEKLAQAPEKSPLEKTALLDLALNHCLDVLYERPEVVRTGEVSDAFWVKEAGTKAARLCEVLGNWSQAINVYERMCELLPPLRPKFEEKLRKAREQQLASHGG